MFAFAFSRSQNTYDLYKTSSSYYPAVDQYSNILTGYVTSGYAGEYQIFLKPLSLGIPSSPGNYWIQPAFSANAITYKIELVSFPFFLNCTNCVGAHISPPISTTTRKLYMPNTSFPYDPSQNAWVRDITGFPAPGPGATYQYVLRREFSAQYGVPTGGYTNVSALASKGFVNGNSSEQVVDDQIFYPHSILKHTFYMHCDNDPLSPAVDSFSFVLDHTRGRMRDYPFSATNAPSSNNFVYDIPISPSIIFSSGIFDETPNDLNTINYFPLVDYDNVCSDHIPEVSGASASAYLRPAPYSLVQTFLGDGLGDNAAGYDYSHAILTGIQQEYYIDRTFDLTIINPSEKIIYNPSEVSIDLDQPYNTTHASHTLVFPSGYTFKTVSGVYPTETQVLAEDPDHMHAYDYEIPVPTTLTDDNVAANDGVFSYYYVESGSTLNIMPCVQIYDTKIIARPGSVINYNSTTVSGKNYSIISTGGTINSSYSFTAPASCRFDCYDVSKYDINNDVHVTSNQTWTTSSLPMDYVADGIMRISGTLIIDAGVTLTVTGGVRFEFGENGKLVVEPGAKLYVNGTTANPTIFTSTDLCGNGMWNGIEVRGDRTLGQGVLATSPQGVVKIKNAKISNSRNALSTRKEGDNWNYNGGIIQCTNVEFLNNRRSAEFLSYHNSSASPGAEPRNLSYFIDCQFFVTDYLHDPHYRLADGRRFGSVNQVTLWDVKNVVFEGCLFENKALQSDGITPLFNTDQRGGGIFAIDADVRMSGGTKKNTFKGFSDGVWLISTTGTDFISITGTDFINNINGLVLEGTELSEVDLNTFLIPAHETNSYILSGSSYNKGYNKPVGLYLIGASDFAVRENTFDNFGYTSSTKLPPEKYNYGIVVNNCVWPYGDGTGNVYKNTISRVSVGLQAELDNRGNFIKGSSDAGLQYKCNEFTSRIRYDVVVPSTSTVTSLLRNQGLCTSLDPQAQAGNSYTSCSGSEEIMFDPSSAWLDNSSFQYRDQPSQFSCSNLTTADDNCFGFVTPNSCSSEFDDCPEPPCEEGKYVAARILAVQSQQEYEQLLDGGNSNELLLLINSDASVGDVKNVLIGRSPYLSDEVLLAMLNRTNDPFSPVFIKDIALANSPLTKSLMDAVEAKGMPAADLEEIVAAQIGTSARAEKENEVGYYAFRKKLAAANLKRNYLRDDNFAAFAALAQEDTSASGLFKLMKQLIKNREFVQAEAVKTQLINKGNADENELLFLSTTLELAAAGKTWLNMTAEQSVQIEQIYLAKPETAVNARAVLAFIKGLKYERYPMDIQETGSVRIARAESNDPKKAALKIYPNPATNAATVELTLAEENKEVQLIIYNLFGKEIQRLEVLNNKALTIDTQDLANGIYLFVLKSGAEIKEKQKVIISR